MKDFFGRGRVSLARRSAALRLEGTAPLAAGRRLLGSLRLAGLAAACWARNFGGKSEKKA